MKTTEMKTTERLENGAENSPKEMPYQTPSFRVACVELEQSITTTSSLHSSGGVVEETFEESIDNDAPFTLL